MALSSHWPTMANILFGQWLGYAAVMSSLPPSRTADKIMIRLPDGMREKLIELAQQNGRSVNAEAVARLEKSFENDDAARELEALVERHEETLADLGARLGELESLVADMNHYGLSPRR